MSNSTIPSPTPPGVLYDDITWFGICLAIVSNAFISTSLNVQKWAHNKNVGGSPKALHQASGVVVRHSDECDWGIGE
eukprot:CAMPEP_0172083790 /NCGR_PEP_ID=MMETSP1043-20130122/20634_1 /TAXON_ID=464988 /ORGANISM="Hemiselmis andersenii, Strain CCMP441" /LENGTH=76 /DNA_ID=CAMNT_0012745543 /DNA_START=325 /DNA_END=552 /DNA_ORIENTATION=-